MIAQETEKRLIPRGGMEWDRVVKVTCSNNCSYQAFCLLHAYVKDGVVTRVEQSATHPSQHDPNVPDWNPRGCQKGMVVHNRMYDPARLKYPLKRVGPRGSGQWQRVSWDEALTGIADTMLDVFVTEGPESVMNFGGSSGGPGSHRVAFESLMAYLGVATFDVNSEIGDDHAGTAQVFGQPFLSCSADNWFHAETFFIWGGNPAYTNIPNYHFITEARYNGTKIITISPDYSASAVQADLWVPVKIGSDAALALAMAQVVIQEKLYKAEFLREQTDLPFLVRTDTRRYLREKDLKRRGRDDVFYVWDAKKKGVAEAARHTLVLGGSEPALEGEFQVNTVDGKVKVKPVFQLLKEKLDREYTPEQASAVTGVSPTVIRQLAQEFRSTRKVVNITTFNWGKFYHGDLIERSIALVFVLGGHVGEKGNSYSGYSGIATDAIVGAAAGGGLSLRGRTTFLMAASNDPRYPQWQQEGWTPSMIAWQYGREAYKQGRVFSSSIFHYLHSGLLELSEKHNSWDPTLKRPVGEYVREAFERGWQAVVPGLGKEPRVLINMGGSALRRVRATNVVLETLLPKLKLMASIDFRMGSTNLYSDYVLPCAFWWEKWVFLGCYKVELPYNYLSQKAVEPPGEAKNEWEIFLLLAKKLEEQAKKRGISSFTDKDGVVHRLDNLYDRITVNGTYLEEDEEAMARDFYANTDNAEHMDWEEFKTKGYAGATGVGQNVRGIGNACDIVPGETVVPLTHHTQGKQPYPTLTRRIQFYIDHDWYLELGQDLPTHLEPPKSGGDYPIVLTGGHTRWSVHSNHADEAILLRLQRGQPTVFMSIPDAQSRGVQDGGWVEVFNDVASTRLLAVVSPSVRPGQAIIYHGWENFQFPGKKHFKGVMPAPLNPVELVGDYFHVNAMPVCFNPGHSDRDTRVEIRKG